MTGVLNIGFVTCNGWCYNKYHLPSKTANNKSGLVFISWTPCHGITNGSVLTILEGLSLDGS